MFNKNCITLLGALAAAQGVFAAPQAIGVSESDPEIPAFLPKHVQNRWLRCSGKETDGTTKPCTREFDINMELLARNNATSGNAKNMKAYAEDLDKSVEYNTAQECCFVCKSVNGIHSKPEDVYWRSRNSKQLRAAWVEEINGAIKSNKTAPDFWAFTQAWVAEKKIPYPASITLEEQAQTEEVKTEAQYCPTAAGDNKPAEKQAPTTKVEYSETLQLPAAPYSFYLKESVQTDGSPQSNTSVEFVAVLYIAECLVVGTPGNTRTVFGPPQRVSDQAPVKIDNTLSLKVEIDTVAECTVCSRDAPVTRQEVVQKSMLTRPKRAAPEFAVALRTEIYVAVNPAVAAQNSVPATPVKPEKTKGNSAAAPVNPETKGNSAATVKPDAEPNWC